MTVTLHSLDTGDEPGAWSDAGFTLEDGQLVVGTVRIRCLGDGGGHDRWVLRAARPPDHDDVDGIATTWTHGADPEPGTHPNGVTRFDHVVLRSPDLDRTTEALGALGLDLRRIRDVDLGEQSVQQRFFRMGEVILELVGPPAPTGDGPCRIWGYAFVTEDIDAATAHLGDRCCAAKEAVQPGRRIATVRTRELGIGPTIALMTPHTR